MFKNKSPLQAGLMFGLIMVVFTAIYQYFEGSTVDEQLLISSFVGVLLEVLFMAGSSG